MNDKGGRTSSRSESRSSTSSSRQAPPMIAGTGLGRSPKTYPNGGRAKPRKK